jgi:hypothetical protein
LSGCCFEECVCVLKNRKKKKIRNVPAPDNIVGVDDGFKFDRLGIRVPTLVISAFVEAGIVHGNDTRLTRPTPSSQLDHTSILSSARKWLKVQEGPLTRRDAWATSFENLLSRSTAREVRRREGVGFGVVVLVLFLFCVLVLWFMIGVFEGSAGNAGSISARDVERGRVQSSNQRFAEGFGSDARDGVGSGMDQEARDSGEEEKERERETHTHNYWTGTFARVFAASSSACAVQEEEAGRSVWSPDFSYSSFGWEQV